MMRRIFGAMLALGLLAPAGASTQVEPEVTANAGWLSQYYFRGILQKTSSANAGADVAAGAFSAGTWAADVGDGAEVDVYAALGTELTEMISVSVGGTGYFYTGEFDDTYLEGNLGVGIGPISIDYALGSYRTSPTASDYSIITVTVEGDGFFATGGAWGQSGSLVLEGLFDSGQYLEAGYGFTAADLDFAISGIFNSSDLSGALDDVGLPTQELTLVLGVSKTFEIPVG